MEETGKFEDVDDDIVAVGDDDVVAVGDDDDVAIVDVAVVDDFPMLPFSFLADVVDNVTILP